MAKQQIIVTHSDLEEMVAEATKQVLQESRKRLITEYYERMNSEQGGGPIFPNNKYAIYVYGDDHDPPHFHIECEGWNVSFTIWKGDLLQIKGKGNKSDLDYMIQMAPRWLNSRSLRNKRQTNRQRLIIQWNILCRNHPINYSSKHSHMNIQNNSMSSNG